MRVMFIFFALLSLICGATSSHAAEDAGSVAERFYAGYVAQVDANKDTRKWVAGSNLVTANFKKAYQKAMSGELDADPVLRAQDVPSAPFKAGKPEINGASASVVLSSSFGDHKHQLTVKLMKVNGAWLLDSVK